MKQEDKDLLLKDLCARLPYGVKAYVKNWSKLDRKWYEDTYTIDTVCPSLNDIMVASERCFVEVILGHDDYEIKPYLFPISTMTEEQCLEIEILTNGTIGVDKDSLWDLTGYSELDISTTLELIQWLYENHFDIYGLIPKGLAIDATGLNIY